MPNSFTASAQQLFQSLYGSVSKVTGGIWSRMGGSGWTRFRYLLPGSRFDFEREAGHTWLNPVVGLAIDWMGNRFPRPRLHVSKISQVNGEHGPLPRHELIDLWNRPNEHYTRRTMEKAVGLSLKCDGNAYIYKVRDGNGRVIQLWWIPHYRCLPTWPPDGTAYIDGYRIWVDSNVYWVPKTDVIHIRDGIDPINERLGLSALRSNLREVCTVNEESGFRASILRNSGVPSIAIIPEDTSRSVTKDDADDIRAEFVERFGSDNRGLPAVLAGKYKIVQIGYSPEQLNLVSLPVIPTARILSALGVAAMSLGLPDPDKTYSNIDAANRMSWGSIISVQELIAENLQWDMLPEFGDDPYQYAVGYDYSDIQELQEALDAVHTRAREDFKVGGITRNEWRERIGLSQIDNGDTFMPGTGGVAEDPTKVALSERSTSASSTESDVDKALSEDDKDQAMAEKVWNRVSSNGNGRLPKDDHYFTTVNRILDALDAKFNPYHDERGRFTDEGGATVSAGDTAGTTSQSTSQSTQAEAQAKYDLADSKAKEAEKVSAQAMRKLVSASKAKSKANAELQTARSTLDQATTPDAKEKAQVAVQQAEAKAKTAESNYQAAAKTAKEKHQAHLTASQEAYDAYVELRAFSKTKQSQDDRYLVTVNRILDALERKYGGGVGRATFDGRPLVPIAEYTSDGKCEHDLALELDAKHNPYHDERGRFTNSDGSSDSPLDLAGQPYDKAAAVYDRISEGWQQSLSQKQVDAIKLYSKAKFADINSSLRRGTKPSKTIANLISGIDQALSSASLSQSTVVYRGISDFTKLGLKADSLSGATFKDNGFLSTSLRPGVAEGIAGGGNSAVLRITAPAGSPGASLSGISEVSLEREVLFARGGTITVNSATKQANGRYLLDATISWDESKAMIESLVFKGSDDAITDDDRLASKFGWNEGDVEVVFGSDHGTKDYGDSEANTTKAGSPQPEGNLSAVPPSDASEAGNA